MSSRCHLDYIVSGKNSSDILIFVSLCCFLLVACKIFPVSLVFSNLIMMFLSVVLCFFYLDFVEILKAVVCRFHPIWKSFGCYFFNCLFFFSLFPITCLSDCQIFSHTSLILLLLFFSLFLSVLKFEEFLLLCLYFYRYFLLLYLIYFNYSIYFLFQILYSPSLEVLFRYFYIFHFLPHHICFFCTSLNNEAYL